MMFATTFRFQATSSFARISQGVPDSRSLLKLQKNLFSMASKRKTKVQDILFRARVRKTTVDDVNGPKDEELPKMPPKPSLSKDNLGLPKNDPHSDIPLNMRSAPTIPKPILIENPTEHDLDDYDYYDDIVEPGVDFRPDDIMLRRIANGEYDPNEGANPPEDAYGESDFEELLGNLKEEKDDQSSILKRVTNSIRGKTPNMVDEDSQSIYDYFTKDYREEVIQARHEAEEELYIPQIDEEEDGYVIRIFYPLKFWIVKTEPSLMSISFCFLSLFISPQIS